MRTKHNQGFALLSVLWCAGILAVIVALMSRTMVAESMRFRANLGLAQAQAMADGAVRMTILDLLDKGLTQGIDPTQVRGQEGAHVVVQDLSGLVNINLIPKESLLSFLQSLGWSEAESTHLSDEIMIKRFKGNGDKTFQSPLELLELPSVTLDQYKQLEPLVTVFSSEARSIAAVAPKSVVQGFSKDLMLTTDHHRLDTVRIAAGAQWDGVEAHRIADVRVSWEPHAHYTILSWQASADE